MTPKPFPRHIQTEAQRLCDIECWDGPSSVRLCAVSALDPHLDPVLGTKRNAQPESDFLVRHEAQPVALGDHCDNESCFGHGERGADANARPSAKRQVRKPRAWTVGAKTVGIKPP